MAAEMGIAEAYLLGFLQECVQKTPIDDHLTIFCICNLNALYMSKCDCS